MYAPGGVCGNSQSLVPWSSPPRRRAYAAVHAGARAERRPRRRLGAPARVPNQCRRTGGRPADAGTRPAHEGQSLAADAGPRGHPHGRLARLHTPTRV